MSAAIDSEVADEFASIDRGNFEWVADWKVLRPLLSPDRLGLAPTAHVVDIGCGTSLLPVQLASMYTKVTGVDREPHCAASMTAQYGDRAGLEWVTCDITCTDFGTHLADESANLVVDKGMLDCALVHRSLHTIRAIRRIR